MAPCGTTLGNILSILEEDLIMAKVEQILNTVDPVSEETTQESTHTDVRKVTAAELKAMGLSVTKVRKVVNYSETDAGKNAKMKLGQYRAEAIAVYKKIMRLADGQFSHDGKDYPVKVSDSQRQWVMDALVELHAATDNALETGIRPTVVAEPCPD